MTSKLFEKMREKGDLDFEDDVKKVIKEQYEEEDEEEKEGEFGE